MRNIQRLAGGCAALAMVLATGCGFALRPFTFDPLDRDWRPFNGRWTGTYAIEGTREGLIDIRIDGGRTRAVGNVLMTGVELIPIHFVTAHGGRLEGSLEPYWDPARNCTAFGSFVGSRDGPVLAGTFISVCDDGQRVAHGHWLVRRHSGS